MKHRKLIFALVLLIALPILLAGCVPGDARYDAENPAGFFWGLWHGMIAWITFFMGVFTGGRYTIYEAANTGWAYNLGFLLGIGGEIAGILANKSRKKCSRSNSEE
jgi:hypothetical protein